MDRRTFLSWAGLGAIATSLPLALAACSSDSSSGADSETAPTEADSAADSSAASGGTAESSAAEGFVAVGSVSALDNNGTISNGQFAGGSGKLIVFKNGDDVVALDANCPHAGCAVDWNGSELVCPCHNSTFSADGSPISGPAQEGLGSFEAKVEGDQVLVSSS